MVGRIENEFRSMHHNRNRMGGLEAIRVDGILADRLQRVQCGRMRMEAPDRTRDVKGERKGDSICDRRGHIFRKAEGFCGQSTPVKSTKGNHHIIFYYGFGGSHFTFGKKIRRHFEMSELILGTRRPHGRSKDYNCFLHTKCDNRWRNGLRSFKLFDLKL